MHPVPFLSVFALIFLAELPDKTLYAILLLAARGRPLPVLLGACAAFLVHGFIALGLGVLAGHLPARAVGLASAAVFLGFGLALLLRGDGAEEERPPAPPSRALVEAFALVFAAEWGDATQIGTAALVARMPHHPWLVFCGATSALWSGAALAVALGRKAGRSLPRPLLRKAAGAVFCAFGLASAVHALAM